MSIGFVSTSVLESKDGIGFDEEKRIESEEVRAAERRAKEAAGKPLWQQLQERAEEKEEKYEEVRKSFYAPPKGLDEEEWAYLEGVEQRKEAAQEESRAMEAKELEAFALARANQTLSSVDVQPPTFAVASATCQEEARNARAKKAAAAPVVVVKRKRKKDPSASSLDGASKSARIEVGQGQEGSLLLLPPPAVEKEKESVGGSLTCLLADYDSD